MTNVDGAQAVHRATAILDLFSPARLSVSVAEASKELGLARATAHRLMSALKTSGYLRLDEASGRYHVGARVLRLAKAYAASHTLRSLARPHLEKLVGAINESASLFVRQGPQRYCIARQESSQAMRVMVEEGQGLPLVGAAGRLLLLDAPSARKAGTMLSRGERVPNAWGIATGVFDESGALVAALEVSGPLERLSDAKAKRYAKLLARTAAGLSAELGDRASRPQ